MNFILHRSDPSPLPDSSDDTTLTNSFGKFFKEKIDRIRAILNATPCGGDHPNPPTLPQVFLSFSPVSEDDIRKIISSSQANTVTLTLLLLPSSKTAWIFFSPQLSISSTCPFLREFFLPPLKMLMSLHC